MIEEEPWEEVPLEPTQLPLVLTEVSLREARKAVSKIKYVLEIAQEFRNILEKEGMLGSLPVADGVLDCIAIDSDFTYPPLELVAGRLFIAIRACVFWGSSFCKDKPRVLSEALVRFLRDSVEERTTILLAKRFERQLANELLEAKARGEANFEALLIDGEIIPRVPLIYRSAFEAKVSRGLIDELRTMIELASDTKTYIIGIIKRVQGRDLSIITGVKLPFNDKAVGTLILRSGEYISIGKVHEIIKKASEGEVKPSRRWLKRIVEKVPEIGEVGVFLFKTRNFTLYDIATKIEAYIPQGLSTGDFVKVLAKLARLTGQTGVPHPTDLADRICSIRGDIIGSIHQKLISDAVKEMGDISGVIRALGLINPEKLYPYEYRAWRIRPRHQ